MPVCSATLHDGQGEEVQLVTCHRPQLVYAVLPLFMKQRTNFRAKPGPSFQLYTILYTFHAVSINTARLRVENSVQTNISLSPK